MVAVALVVTESASASVRTFWINHPVLAALVASAVTLAVTGLIVDELVRRQRAGRSRTVAETAYRELSTDAFRAWTGVMTGLGFPEAEDRFLEAQERSASTGRLPGGQDPPVLSEEFEDVVTEAIEHEEIRRVMGGLIYRETDALGQSVARWAPVMLQDADPAEALDLFSTMREALIHANRGLRAAGADPNWQWGFWVSLDWFFLLFARFDSLRREALGDPTMFGTEKVAMRAAWGLPADRPAPPSVTRS